MKIMLVVIILILAGCGYSEKENKILDRTLRWSAYCESRGGNLVNLYYGKTHSYYCKDGSHTHFGDR